MKKRILISTFIALMLGVIQPMSGAISLDVHGYAETDAQETDNTTDDGVTPSSVTPDTVKITEEGEIIWMSNHARRDEINTLRLNLQITPEKADTVTVEFHTGIADGTSGYKVEDYRYNPTTGLLDIYLADIKSLFALSDSDNPDGIDLLNIGTITVIGADGTAMPINSDIVQIIDDSLQYVYQNELTIVAVAAEIGTAPEIVIPEETEETIETTEETPVESTTTTTSTVAETTTSAPATTTTVVTTSTVKETTTSALATTTSKMKETTTSAPATTTSKKVEETTTSAPATTVATTVEETTTSAPATTVVTTSAVKETTTSALATTVATTSKVKETTTSVPATTVSTTSKVKETTTSVPATTAVTTSKVEETTTSAPATTVVTTSEVEETIISAPAITVVTTSEVEETITSAPATTVVTTSKVKETTTSAPATTVATTSKVEETTTSNVVEITTSNVVEITTEAVATEEAVVSAEATTIKEIVTEETTATHIASDEDLCDWAIVDYEDKTGITVADAEITNEENGQYEITLTDQDDEVLDVYIIDPNTGTGVEVNHNEEVNLPQTGNNSLTNILIAVGAFMMVEIGFYTVKISGVIRHRGDE